MVMSCQKSWSEYEMFLLHVRWQFCDCESLIALWTFITVNFFLRWLVWCHTLCAVSLFCMHHEFNNITESSCTHWAFFWTGSLWWRWFSHAGRWDWIWQLSSELELTKQSFLFLYDWVVCCWVCGRHIGSESTYAVFKCFQLILSHWLPYLVRFLVLWLFVFTKF